MHYYTALYESPLLLLLCIYFICDAIINRETAHIMPEHFHMYLRGAHAPTKYYYVIIYSRNENSRIYFFLHYLFIIVPCIRFFFNGGAASDRLFFRLLLLFERTGDFCFCLLFSIAAPICRNFSPVPFWCTSNDNAAKKKFVFVYIWNWNFQEPKKHRNRRASYRSRISISRKFYF